MMELIRQESADDEIELWGETRSFNGLEVRPMVDIVNIPPTISFLVVTRVPPIDEVPAGTYEVELVYDSYGCGPPLPIAYHVDISRIEEAWVDAPYSDWLALPK